MKTDSARKAQSRYFKKLKEFKIRFSLKEEPLYHDFRKKCEERGIKPTSQIKSLIDQWTYLDIGFDHIAPPDPSSDINKHPSNK